MVSGMTVRKKTLLFRLTISAVITMAISLGAGCKKKKPPVPPPQAQAPTITVPTLHTRPIIVPPSTWPATEVAAVPAPPVKTPKRPKPKKTIPPVVSQPKPTPPPTSPAKTDPGSVSVSADVPQDAAAVQRRNTEQLLQSAEANVKRITRTLNDGEQASLRQVRNYITQARLAAQDGDLERAYNLAVKANLLSADLTK